MQRWFDEQNVHASFMQRNVKIIKNPETLNSNNVHDYTKNTFWNCYFISKKSQNKSKTAFFVLHLKINFN